MSFSRTLQVLLIGLSTSVAAAEDIRPAVVFDMGGKFDKSFNEGVYNGVKKFQEETGISYREFEVTNETQREQAVHCVIEFHGEIPLKA